MNSRIDLASGTKTLLKWLEFLPSKQKVQVQAPVPPEKKKKFLPPNYPSLHFTAKSWKKTEVKIKWCFNCCNNSTKSILFADLGSNSATLKLGLLRNQ
jgi:hypothetical protein